MPPVLRALQPPHEQLRRRLRHKWGTVALLAPIQQELFDVIAASRQDEANLTSVQS